MSKPASTTSEPVEPTPSAVVGPGSPYEAFTASNRAPEAEASPRFDRKSIGPLIFVVGSFLVGAFLFQQLFTPDTPEAGMKKSLALYGIELADEGQYASLMEQCRVDPMTHIRLKATFGGTPDTNVIIVCDPEDNTKVNTAASYVPKR